MENKERFLSIYREYIHREGNEKLLDYLLSEYSDSFRAPASTRFHNVHARGLLEHSLNVYDRLKDYLNRLRVRKYYRVDYNEETIAIVALLHGIYKTNCYKESARNQKAGGQWVQVPFYKHEDRLPCGHSEKSVYITTGLMRLSREEVFVIHYHIGLSGNKEAQNVDVTFEIYPLVFALSVADMEAIYYPEGKQQAVIEKDRKQTK